MYDITLKIWSENICLRFGAVGTCNIFIASTWLCLSMKSCKEDTVLHQGFVLLFQKNEELCDLQQPSHLYNYMSWLVCCYIIQSLHQDIVAFRSNDRFLQTNKLSLGCKKYKQKCFTLHSLQLCFASNFFLHLLWDWQHYQ